MYCVSKYHPCLTLKQHPAGLESRMPKASRVSYGYDKSQTRKTAKDVSEITSELSLASTILLSGCLLAPLPETRTILLHNPTHLDSNSRVSPVSSHSQFQGAAVLKALVQGRFKVYPHGVRVIFLGLGLVAAHHLGKTGQKQMG